MHSIAESRVPHCRASIVFMLAVALVGLVAACGSDGDEGSGAVTTDPVTVDALMPDGGDLAAVPWDEVGPGWTLAAYDPGSLDDVRTAGLFLIDPDGRRWAVTTVELGERDGVGVEDWLPDPPRAVVARRHHTGIDENPKPGGLDLVDLVTGDRRALTVIDDVQANVATLSRPSGKVIVFAEGVGGPLQRRSLDFELLSTLAVEAFDWAHSPDGALVAVGTLPPTAPSRLTVNANDTGDELIDLPVPPAYRFCHPVGWWDARTLMAGCGNTGVLQPRELWHFPMDGSAPRQLFTGDGSAVTGAAQQPDGTWLLATTDGVLWTAGDNGTELGDLPDDASVIGASTSGALILVDGELAVVETSSGATVTLVPRQSDESGVVSAVTLTAAAFTAERPAIADGEPPTDGSSGGSGAPAPEAPVAGTVLDVVGVTIDDVLNFRVDPDPAADIVVTAHPDTSERREDAVIVATGEAATTGSSVWWQVTVDGQEAWANSRFLGVLAARGDAPELVDLEAVGGQTLQDVVAEARPPGDATGVLLEAFGVDAISSIFVIDVLGSYGGGIKGERFEIEALNIRTFDDEEGPRVIGARIWTAIRTPICDLGVDAAGNCS